MDSFRVLLIVILPPTQSGEESLFYMKPVVVIIGAGAMGQVMGALMGKKAPVLYWDATSGKVPNQRELSEVLKNAVAVFLCVPSGAVRVAAMAAASYLRRDVPVVTIAKGIEAKTGKFMPEVLQESLRPGQPYGIVSGPMLASELGAGQGGSGVVAVSSAPAYKIIVALFVGSSLKLFYSKELSAVALGGVLKNIYAVIIGIALGLGWKHNRIGALISDEINEILRIFGEYGLPMETAVGPACLGDLLATGLSADSRNHQIGEKLAINEEGTSEGTRALPFVFKRVKKLGRKNLPLLFALADVLARKKTARAAFQK
ncbi:MAG: Glycerol-3-phosphate dehydrogenase [NAD(P)+] [Parcubacteria group bacterium GW2011_GWA2_53_21]|nr:MAG: Glycerol-3-phosphate dehydrogenase [NAD(P)+] [Parcubacteria group bacterium GW2011_GWA2_53_21]